MRVSTEHINRIFSACLGRTLRPVSKTKDAQALNGQDSAVFSSRTAELDEARQLVANTPAIRQARVVEVRQQIADGTFQVSNDAIADAIIAEARGHILPRD